jgi:acyl transferase domain-containing protein
MFSGQGTQTVNMGLDLYAEEPTFREQVDLCAEMLKPHLGLDLRQVLYPPTAGIDEAAGHLAQTAMAQPALFVIEYALARLWLAWGVRPAAMIGHSIGEYVAACLAGVFSLTDALSLVAARGRLMQQLPVGAMLAVSLPVSEVQSFLSQGLSLAAVNGPSQCVISGTEGAVEAVKGRLDQAGIACRRLRTSHAFHSEMMEPILDAFAAQVKQVTLHPPQIPYVSNLTGIWITAAEATDPIYWAKHIRQPVRFATGLAELLTESSQILLEVGSGQTLATLAKQQNESATDSVVLASLPDPKAQASDVKFFLTTLGQLWLAGAAVDWSGFYAHERRQRLPLPTYPFERRRYWIEPQAIDTTATTLVRKADLADWFYLPSWKRSVISNGYHRHDRFCWLLFVDEGGLGSRLAKQLEQKRQDVIIVRTGSEFARLGDRLYTLNPEQTTINC